jgi:proteasome lid subunit RPN8/RPN11
MPISLPGEDRLQPGAHRDLVIALHELYIAAGSPPLRKISRAINLVDNYDAALSHETIGRMLNGLTIPSWLSVKTVVQLLASWGTPPSSSEEQAKRFLALWNAAKRVPQISLETSGIDAVAANQSVPGPIEQSGSGSATENRGEVRSHHSELGRISVILSCEGLADQWDVSLPIDVTVKAIIAKLIESNQLPFAETDELGLDVLWVLRWNEAGRDLALEETFGSADVRDGDTLVMHVLNSPKQQALSLPNFRLYILEAALSGIRGQVRRNGATEAGGVLLGRNFEVAKGIVVAVNSHHPVESGSSHEIELSTQTLGIISANGADRVVGWYHSHALHAPFMSMQDRRLHSKFFTAPWHVSCVVSSEEGEPVGFWRESHGRLIEVKGHELEIV